MFAFCRDNVKNVSVSPAKSRFYRYDFPHDVSSVIVKAQSNDDLCAVLSVQEAEVISNNKCTP